VGYGNTDKCIPTIPVSVAAEVRTSILECFGEIAHPLETQNLRSSVDWKESPRFLQRAVGATLARVIPENVAGRSCLYSYRVEEGPQAP
jgi:hypothetical protein